jgi:hypothetical protein
VNWRGDPDSGQIAVEGTGVQPAGDRELAAISNNPYEPPRESCAVLNSKAPTELAALRFWRGYLAIHLLFVVATFVATMLDTGYWKLNSAEGSGFHVLIYALMMLVAPGIFLAMFVSPIIILVLFARAYNLDKRYAVVGLAELLLYGAHLFIALPLCQ